MWGISWWQAGSTRLLRSPTFSNNLTSHTIDNAIPDHSHTMDRALDRSLDDILGDRKQVRQKPTSPPPSCTRQSIVAIIRRSVNTRLQNNSRGSRGGGRRRDRSDYPRDGVRKVRTHDNPGKASCHLVKKYTSAQIWPSGKNTARLIEPSLLPSCSSPRSYSTWFERRSYAQDIVCACLLRGGLNARHLGQTGSDRDLGEGNRSSLNLAG